MDTSDTTGHGQADKPRPKTDCHAELGRRHFLLGLSPNATGEHPTCLALHPSQGPLIFPEIGVLWTSKCLVFKKNKEAMVPWGRRCVLRQPLSSNTQCPSTQPTSGEYQQQVSALLSLRTCPVHMDLARETPLGP